MRRRLVILACLAPVWHAKSLAQDFARLTILVRDSSPGAQSALLQPRPLSQINLTRLGATDVVTAHTDSSGRASFTLRAGRYDRFVRAMGHDFRRDTFTIASGEQRADSIVLETLMACLGTCPLQGKALRDFQMNQRRVLAARSRWSCKTRGDEIEPQRQAWQQLLADTTFRFDITPAQRRATPRLVTDRQTCRRIADLLARRKQLNTTTPLVFSIGRFYFVTEPGEVGLVISHTFRYVTGFVVG
jgi:hypothetical protein